MTRGFSIASTAFGTSSGVGNSLAGKAAIVVVSRTRPLRRYHAGANRRFGRARGAEYLALPRLQHALEHLTALACLRGGDPHSGQRKDLLRVIHGVGGPQLER